jgi:hypothetical protein
MKPIKRERAEVTPEVTPEPFSFESTVEVASKKPYKKYKFMKNKASEYLFCDDEDSDYYHEPQVKKFQKTERITFKINETPKIPEKQHVSKEVNTKIYFCPVVTKQQKTF